MVLKQIVEMIFHMYGFRSLQTYMVLKLAYIDKNRHNCFRALQTYMVLKLHGSLILTRQVLDPYKLTWFSNL